MEANTLYEIMRSIDPSAELLAADASCEWVRSTLAIVGRIALETPLPADEAQRTISEKTAHAYAVLDDLPDAQLSSEDLWNLLLMISVPWKRTEIVKLPQIGRILSNFVADTSGSRKIILWADTSPKDNLGPLGKGAVAWMPPTDDPLRDVIEKSAQNDDERTALSSLFKRRIQDEDIDQLVRALGRKKTNDL